MIDGGMLTLRRATCLGTENAAYVAIAEWPAASFHIEKRPQTFGCACKHRRERTSHRVYAINA